MTEGRLELHPNAEVIAVDLDTGRRIFEVRLRGPARLRHWYCAGKPILATAIAAAHDAGTIDLDGPVGLRASEVSAEAAARPAGWRCRLVDLLRHTADLHRLGVLTARLLAVPDLQAMCLDLLSTAQRTGPHGATYAPVAGWVLAAMELERWRDPELILLRAADPAAKLVLAPDEAIDGRAHAVIKLRAPVGAIEVAIYLDRKTKLVSRMTYSDGGASESDDFADYKEVGGIKLAHRRTSLAAGRTTTLELKAVEVDPKLDAATFAKPAS